MSPTIPPSSCPLLLGVVGFSGAGKTTLLEQLLPLLRSAGERCAVIKHAHHDVDVDTPGKDSYRLRKAGAVPMLLASAQRYAIMVETPEAQAPGLDELVEQLLPHAPSLILIEGFKHAAIPRLEVFRAALGRPLLARDDAQIIAVAAPTEEEVIRLRASNVVAPSLVTTQHERVQNFRREPELLPLDSPADVAQWIVSWACQQRTSRR